MAVSRNQGAVRYVFGGINNRLDGSSATPGRNSTMADLETAENVVITDSYGIKTRPGSQEYATFSDGHSAWSNAEMLLFVAESALNRFDGAAFDQIADIEDDTRRMFYVEAGSAVLFSNGEQIAGIFSGEVDDIPDPGQQFKLPIPAAKHLAWYNGRVYGATDDGLIYSDTYRLSIDERNFLIPLGRVRMVCPVKGGMYVSYGSRTVFMQGSGPEDFIVYAVHNFPAIDGAYAEADAAIFSDVHSGVCCVFATARGVFAGFSDGTVKEITNERYLVEDDSSGTVFIHQSGQQVQIYVSLLKE